MMKAYGVTIYTTDVWLVTFSLTAFVDHLLNYDEHFRFLLSPSRPPEGAVYHKEVLVCLIHRAPLF